LSITNDWPKRVLKRSASTRPTLSVAVPGGKPTTKVTGLVGQAALSCACAAVRQHDKAHKTRNRKPGWLMETPCNGVRPQDVADYSAPLKFDNHLGDSKSRGVDKKKPGLFSPGFSSHGKNLASSAHFAGKVVVVGAFNPRTPVTCVLQVLFV